MVDVRPWQAQLYTTGEAARADAKPLENLVGELGGNRLPPVAAAG